MKHYNFKLKDGEGGFLLLLKDDEQAEKMLKALEDATGQKITCEELES